ncbi:hypothetical protein KUA24_10 [Vibrio phage HNL01]|nr:hypothetical protein KUA24_10 [Vibrio phage HNL01]
MLNIYMVRCLTDITEGRRGYRDVISFVSGGDAWAYANKQGGVMGRVPNTGDWRTYSGGKYWNVVSVSVWED